jgi:hypothetical protein
VHTTQKILSLAAPLVLAAGTAHSQTAATTFAFIADSTGNYRQAPTGTAFEGGVFSFNVRDGVIIFDGCEAPFFYNPSPLCPIGSTGFVSRGLEDDPLLNGLGPYFSVTEISPAIILRPFAPQNALLVSAPPSQLPRPLLGFENRSISCFYNLFTNFIRQYDVSIYDFARDYAAGERKRFDGEAVPGTYRFNFAALAHPINPAVLSINLFPKLDGFRKINNQNQGVRFLNVAYDDGFAVLDPFELNTVKWEGNGVNFLSTASDAAYFSIKRLEDPSDPLSDPDLEAVPLFPNFSGPNTSRVVLQSPLVNSFIIPPNFMQPGNTGVIDLEFVVVRRTTGVIIEQATRRFRLPVRVTNPFFSAIAASLPPGATTKQLSAEHDFDGDGLSNFNEWVFGSNPASASSLPASLGIQMVSPAPANKFGTAAAASEISSPGAFEFRVPKLTETIPKLRYSIEFSEDMITWNEIQPADPAWNLVNGYSEIKVTSTATNEAPGGFFRAKVEVAN